jgi:hypothetical protein
MPIALDVPMMINIAAIFVMFYCLYSVLSVGRNMAGGAVGRQWRFLTILVVMFTGGYLVTPFFSMVPAELVRILVSLIFFFGAIYVLITIRMVHQIIKELMS